MSDQHHPIDAKRVCAVIVTYHPTNDFEARYRAIADQVDHVIIVDNGSPSNAALRLRELTAKNCGTIILNEENEGIAAALNQGLKAAIAKHYRWCVTLDQDSMPSETMIAELISTLNSYSCPDKVAIVSPTVTLRNIPGSRGYWLRPNYFFPLLFERAICVHEDLDNVTITITSGSLTNLAAFCEVGPFRNDFFIDYVDTEYCLRSRSAGFQILVSARAHLHHSLGEMREVAFALTKVRPRFHSPSRVYYLYRNRIPTLRRYSRTFPHWFLFDSLTATYNLLRILLLEDQRWAKLKACVRGTWDGLRGRMGAQ